MSDKYFFVTFNNYIWVRTRKCIDAKNSPASRWFSQNFFIKL